MKEIWTVIKGNLRKGKSGFISIMIMMFVLSVTMTSVISININSTKRVKQALKDDNFGDLMLSFVDEAVEEHGSSVDELIKKAEESDIVEKLGKIDTVNMYIDNINGKEESNVVYVEKYDEGYYDFKVYEEGEKGLYKEKPELKAGEIAVPVSYKSKFDCKIGDMVYFKAPQGKIGYKIKYFFEDPYMGSSVIGIKTVLMENSDVDKLIASGNNDFYYKGTILDVSKSGNYSGSSMKFTNDLNKETGIGDYASLTMEASRAEEFTLIMTNIFCGILTAFAILLFIISLIVIGHNISSSIELDYENLGILKAVGFTQGKLKASVTVQYLASAFIGCVIGIPVAVAVIAFVNKVTLPVTGLFVSDTPSFAICIPLLIAVLILMCLYILIKLRKMTQITPVRAICGGRSEVYFSSRFNAPIRKKGMNFWMAARNLASGMKQYAGAVLITMVLVFFLIMTTSMNSWVGADGKIFNELFKCCNEDIQIEYKDKSVQEDVENEIKKNTDIVGKYQNISQYMTLNDSKLYVKVLEDPDKFSTLLEGRKCLYDNEILITRFVEEELGITIGDVVTVKQKEKSEEFIISGIYQYANDMGANFAMSKAGYERLTGETMDFGYYSYELADSSQASQIVKDISAKYDKNKLDVYDADEAYDIGSIVAVAIKAITYVIYIIATVFALVIVMMICTKIFAREKVDYGIYKAVGFTSAQLRKQFAVRFAVVAFVGSILGAIMYACLSEYCFGFLLTFMGISDTSFDIPFLCIVLPAVFMIVMFAIFAYLKAGHIKRVNTKILVSE